MRASVRVRTGAGFPLSSHPPGGVYTTKTTTTTVDPGKRGTSSYYTPHARRGVYSSADVVITIKLSFFDGFYFVYYAFKYPRIHFFSVRRLEPSGPVTRARI